MIATGTPKNVQAQIGKTIRQAYRDRWDRASLAETNPLAETEKNKITADTEMPKKYRNNFSTRSGMTDERVQHEILHDEKDGTALYTRTNQPFVRIA